MTDLDFDEFILGVLAGWDVPASEIEKLKRRGREHLVVAVVDRFLLGGGERINRTEVEKRVGMDNDIPERMWRAMGFVNTDEPIFNAKDVEMLSAAMSLVESGAADLDIALQVTRVMGMAAANVAGAQVDAMRDRLETTDGDIENLSVLVDGVLLNEFERFLIYIWRRHLNAAIQRALLAPTAVSEASTTEATVGFCDIVGFTRTSSQLEERELASMVARFESEAHDIVTRHAGTVVKFLGDGVLFQGPNPDAMVQCGITLTETIPDGEMIQDVRVGVASGSVIRHQGDVFGAPVNLASRLMARANPGTVVIDPATASMVSESAVKRIPSFSAKGLGKIEPYVARRPKVETE